MWCKVRASRYIVHHGMQSNFTELKMITDDTKEDVVTIQMMTVSVAVGVVNELEVSIVCNMMQ